MIQKFDRPPNYEDILKAFPQAKNPGVIFSYAPYVYCPTSRQPLPPQLAAHEGVHIQRQTEIGVEEWWRRYIDDPEFRLQEEIIAHAIEYRYVAENAPSRQQRRAALAQIGGRLASALYGKVIPKARAMELIKGAT